MPADTALARLEAQLIHDRNGVARIDSGIEFVGTWYRAGGHRAPWFGTGQVTSSPSARHLRYRLSLRRRVMWATLVVTVLGTLIAVTRIPLGAKLLVPLVTWLWLVVSSTFVGAIWFRAYVRRYTAGPGPG